MADKKLEKLKSLIKTNTLATEMWFVLLSALFVFGVAFLVSTIAISNEARKDSEIRESEIVINSVSGSIRANIDSYKDLSRLIMLNEAVTTFLRAEEVDSGLINDAKYGVMDILNVSNNLDSVFVIRNDGEYMSTGRGEYDVNFSMMDTENWFAPILERRGGAVILMNAGGAIHRRSGIQIITIARAIYDIYTQERTGILLMNISTNMFDEMTRVNENTKISVLSKAGTYLAGDEELSELYQYNREFDKIIYKEFREKNHWKMVSTYLFDDMPLVVMCSSIATTVKLSTTTYIVLLTLFVVFLLAMIGSGAFVTHKINRPIFLLIKGMEKTKESGWMEKIDVDIPKNEIGTLVDSYNRMIEYLNDLFTELIEKEKTVQRAEMRVLHEQIKPHFLYNSLGTISYMAYDAGATDVYNALETLGNFYRNFLSKGDREITVKREITIIKDYLALQKLRYGDIINDEYDISEEILDMKVPKLMLQPLVENCIYHGIRPKGEPGIIKITGSLEDDAIKIVVHDTGVGMTEDEIEEILNKDASEDEETAGMLSGFGLKGTIGRIRYYCNRDDVVMIHSEVGEYTDIIITIPCNIRERDNDVQSNDN